MRSSVTSIPDPSGLKKPPRPAGDAGDTGVVSAPGSYESDASTRPTKVDEFATREIESDSSPASPASPAVLAPEHEAELAASAIGADVAARHGVRSIFEAVDLPDEVRWVSDKHGDAALPALLFPAEEPDGSPTWQVKFQAGLDGVSKYLSPAGVASPELPLIRAVDEPGGVLIVEGTKQARAADAWAPASWAIYQIAGIAGWSRGGVPTRHLRVVRGLPVVIVPDADAKTNRAVYDAAVTLGEACRARRAKSVKYVRLAGFNKTGVDDQLGVLTDPGERRELFEDWIASAATKPADAAPKPLSPAEQEALARKESRSGSGRPVIHVGESRRQVIDECDAAIRAEFGGRTLFQHQGAFGRIVDGAEGPEIEAVDGGALRNMLATAAETVVGVAAQDDDGCGHPHEWPDSNVLSALASLHGTYPRLDGITTVPVVREDGSIALRGGYDTETGLYIALGDDIAGLDVPDSPTDDDVEAARALLVDELFGDFWFKGQPDVASAVAALLTPIIRPKVTNVPLYVIDGQEEGIGKGTLAEVMALIVHGHVPAMDDLPSTEDELRKKLTAYLVDGATNIYFDEAHSWKSAQMSRILTAPMWSDRFLGRNKNGKLRNRAFFTGIGVNVEVNGHMRRRYFKTRLETDLPDIATYNCYRHDDIHAWVREHRRDLLRACLVLVRAWYSRGCPSAPTKPFSFNSFTQWQDMIGGILRIAGIDGFLVDLLDQRVDGDYEGQRWSGHWTWIGDTYGTGGDLLAGAVLDKMADDPDAVYPPGLDRTSTSEQLAGAWRSQAGRWREGLRIVRTDRRTRNKVTIWQLESLGAGGGTPTVAVPATMAVVPDRPMPVITDLDDGAVA